MKTTKYEHILPLLAGIEESEEIDGLLLLLNTVGGDIEAGLAIAEMIAGMKKPTVSLVLGGGHSIGIPLAVCTKKSFITPTVGFSLKNIAFDNFRLGFYADYYLGHIFEDNMKTGFGAGLQSAFLLGNLGNVNLALFINFRESLFVLNDGIDSRSRITIGFGVENNE